MTRTLVQGTSSTTNTLDVLPNRNRSYDSVTGGTTISHTNHYSDDSDNPTWIADGAWYTRPITGLASLAAQYTGATAHLEWQMGLPGFG